MPFDSGSFSYGEGRPGPTHVRGFERFPAYMFENNKGYPAPQHRTALAGYGPCVIHRKSWAFMDDMMWSNYERYDRAQIDQGSLFAA